MPVMASMKKVLKEDSNDPVYIAKMKEIKLKDFTARINANVEGSFSM